MVATKFFLDKTHWAKSWVTIKNNTRKVKKKSLCTFQHWG